MKPRVKPGTPVNPVKSDPGAKFDKVFRFDVSKLEPQVCFPPAPDQTHPIKDGLGVAIDQICIGTCTGGSIYDFREAAKVMKGREVKSKTLIVPATREVYKQCEKEGLLATFIEAGCEVYPAYCGTCQALSIGHIAPGENADAQRSAQLARTYGGWEPAPIWRRLRLVPRPPSRAGLPTRANTYNRRGATMSAQKEWIVEGNAWKVGNNVNTESITPSRWLHEGPAPMREHIAEMLIPEFPKKVQEGDVWFGGKQPGLLLFAQRAAFHEARGHRGHRVQHGGPDFLSQRGEFGTADLRDRGCGGQSSRQGDRVQVNVQTGLIKNLTTGKTAQAKPFPQMIMELLEAGSINGYIRAHAETVPAVASETSVGRADRRRDE